MKTTARLTAARHEAPAGHHAQAQPDQRPATVAQRQLLAGIAASARPVTQRQENRTGLPDNLKAGVENLSAHALDDVKVHYNSAQPASLQAHAYAQGTDIHLAPGQEKHLPHEAWHVVQQKQGRVKPTRQLKGVGLNDSSALEKEANAMGERALHAAAPSTGAAQLQAVASPVVQRNSFEDFETYADARNANAYSRKLLDSQKNDPIEKHLQKPFASGQQEAIYEVNEKRNRRKKITSDQDGRVLHRQNVATTPHIDHRFPKSQGGSNSYTNAQVLPAGVNIKKSNKRGDQDSEPTKALPAYKSLEGSSAFDDKKLSRGKDFSSEQRAAILDANATYYGQGTPVSDGDGVTELEKYDTTRVPHIDHITAKSEGGTNYYFNAMVLPASENMQKSGKRGTNMDIDAEVAEMSLKDYYKQKQEQEEDGRQNKRRRRGSALEDLNEREESSSDEESN